MNLKILLFILISFIGLDVYSQGCFNSDLETGNLDGYTPFVGNIAGDGTITINNQVFSPDQHRVHFILDGFDEIAEEFCIENRRLPVVPQGGGAYALRLGNSNNGAQAERVTLSFTVTEENNFFLLNYAVLLNNPNHQPHEQPRFRLSITDSNGEEYPCGFFEAVAADSIENFENCGDNWKVRPWTAIGIELQSYIGERINIEMSTNDCALGGHAGYAYLDANCKPLQIELFNNCGPGSSAKMFVTTGFDKYEWSTGDSTSVISIEDPVIGESYSVTVTSATGCSIVLTDTIPPISTEPDPVFDPSTVTTICDEVAFNFRPGGTNLGQIYSVELDQFIDSIVINNVTQNSYTFIAFSRSGCPKDTVIHYFNGLPFVTDSIAETFCTGSNEGSISLAPLIPGSTYSYNWSNGDTTSSISNLVAGTYIVTISDENCDYVMDYQVEQPDPISIAVDQDPVICRGYFAEATFYVRGGTPPFGYAYNNGGTFYTNSNIYQQFVEGNNVIYVRDSNNCIDSVTIFFPLVELPEIVSFDITQDSCGNPGNQITVTGATSGRPPYEYNVDFASPFSSQTSFNDFSIGPHTLYIQDANECINRADFEFEFYEEFFFRNLDINHTTCTLSNGDVTIVTSQTDLVQYAVDNRPYQTSNFFGQLAPGSHTAYAFNRNGCLLTRDFFIRESFLPNPIFSQSNNLCDGTSLGEIRLTTPNPSNPYTYVWSTGQTSNILTDLSDGTYEVTITDRDQCVNQFRYEITSPDPLEMDVVGNFSSCQDRATAEIFIDVIGGVGSYSYSNDGGDSYRVDDFFRNIGPDTYLVQVRDGNGCTVETTITIEEYAKYEAVQLDIVNDTCVASVGAVIVENIVNGAPPYLYSIDSAQFQATPQINNLTYGDYTLYLQDDNGCFWEENFRVDTVFSLYVDANVISTTCEEDNGELSVDVSSNFGNLYYLNDSLIGADPILTGLAAGPYKVLVENEFGCRDEVDLIIEEGILPRPEAAMIGNDCYDGLQGQITMTNPFSSTTTYTYAWSNGATGSILTDLGIGTYIVTVTDTDNCKSIFDYEITSPPQISLDVLGRFTNCPNNEDGEISLTANGGTGILEYSINGGLNYGTDTLFSNLKSDTYLISIRDENLCTKDTIIEVLDYTFDDDLNLVLAMDTCVASNGAVTIMNRTQLAGPYRYSIDGIEYYSDTSFVDLSYGDYTLFVEDGNGCVWNQNFQLDSIYSINLRAIAEETTCNEDNGQLVLEASSDFDNRYFLNDQFVGEESTINDLPAGDYTITARNQYGCADTINATVSPSLEPIIDGVSIDYLSCQNNLNDITIRVRSGNPPFNFSIDNNSPQETNLFRNLSPGEHIVRVVDSQNCIKEFIFIVEEFETIELAYDFINPTCDQANGSVSFDLSGGAGPLSIIYEDNIYAADEVIEDLFEGTYTFDVMDTTDCSRSVTILLETECKYYIPNTFTPDNDGIDDVFEIFFSAGSSPTINEFSVYDRWGGLVTRLENVDPQMISIGWDGRFNNEEAQAGIYTFMLVGQFANGEEIFEQGTFTLYR